MPSRQALAAAVLVALSAAVTACSGSSADVGTGPAPDATADEGPDTAQDESELKTAKVTLRIPLLDEDGKLLSKHNAALRAAGLGTFPDTVEIVGGANGTPSANAAKKWNDASVLVDKAYEKLHLEIAMVQYGEPVSYQTKDPKTTICYTGNPMLVVNLVSNLADNVFSDQLGIHGWRYRAVKKLDENLTSEDEATFPNIWKNWRGKGAAILVLSHSSDDGSETNVGLISKCAP